MITTISDSYAGFTERNHKIFSYVLISCALKKVAGRL